MIEPVARIGLPALHPRSDKICSWKASAAISYVSPWCASPPPCTAYTGGSLRGGAAQCDSTSAQTVVADTEPPAQVL